MGPAKALGGLGHDRLRHPARIVSNLAVPKADHRPPFAFQPRRPPRIGGIVGMLSAVHLHRQLCLSARQVDDEWPDHQLPRELRPIARQQPPQRPLSPGRAAAKRAGPPGHLGIDAVHDAMLTQPPATAKRTPLPEREGPGVGQRRAGSTPASRFLQWFDRSLMRQEKFPKAFAHMSNELFREQLPTPFS